MSGEQDRSPRERGSWRRPTTWPLWQQSAPVLCLVLLIISAAFTLTALLWTDLHVSSRELLLAGLLVALGVVHTEVVADIEANRREATNTLRPAGDIGYFDITSAWTVSAALLLPGALSSTATFVMLTHHWTRALRPAGNLAYRGLYSRATSMLACLGTAAVLQTGGVQLAEGVSDLPRLGVVLGALAVYWLINTGLVVLVIPLSRPELTLRDAIGTGAENVLELGTIGLGGILATTLAGSSPWMAVMLLPLVLLLHRFYAVQQIEQSTDGDRGLLNSAAWHRRARRELRECARRRQPAALLLIDLVGFRAFATSRGRRAADEALSSISLGLLEVAGPDDLLGRFGRHDFAVLVPSAAEQDLEQLARKFIGAVEAVEVEHADGGPSPDSFSAAVGCAEFPVSGLTTKDLVSSANQALTRARTGGAGGFEVHAPRGSDAEVSLHDFLASRKKRYG
ncbi:GGDEF domain-containing protein [Pseudonocardia sp. WMMC193]|uniref:sensor domain-containing diguanylate cyclase n=1 Tax=Pseudonocardia sp. WMMC193 TaxID=2911965 RepID=UPI001F2C58D7|nr:GGDEF domain-containing protein [Pseudonocardia sp. WMMC193]MCF7547237.1 GGDEF domain-containing protein [Pseudonocardia sp. WMMC193]